MAKSLSKCKRGHALTRENLRSTGGWAGKYKKCRLCANMAARKWARRHKSLRKKKELEL